ncbi:MAG: hypothetical protein ALECFALPRED_005536 [Alectoria fallacina]|uniref:Uncharacterized protein n=1 Tax=Alectoria fallacina TaxID=1903189 RepID=A0A8H3IY22_9LECA|nr:MAG: hypothetical protein ALECFALPRED_005536 [Alectoria fallacina]
MKVGNRGGRRLLLRYSSGAFIVILLVVLLSNTLEPINSHRGPYDHHVQTSGSESTRSSNKVSDTAFLDTYTSTLNEASNAPSSEGLPNANTLKDTSAAVSDGTVAFEASAAVPSPQIPVAPKAQFDVVIAHHSEEPHYIKVWTDSLRSIPYLQELGMRIIIYTKGSMEPAGIKEASGADDVLQLPNVGREGGTYLHHLLRAYDDPPRFILFAQAKLRKAQEEGSGKMTQWLQDRLRTRFDNETGFMSMDRKHDICYCGHCTDMGRDDFYPLWPQIYSMLQGKVCQRLEGHVLSFNGHFIVSKKRILARSRGIYQYLQALVDAPEDHWIHSEPEPEWFEKDKGKSTPSNPKFGHTLERLWHTIFTCDDPAEVVDCDATGMKVEGPGGCSCRDPP